MSNREIWLYERIEADGSVHPHLYAVLSNEHPIDADFVEDVWTGNNRSWNRLSHREVSSRFSLGFYKYVNFSKNCIKQEWERPVFSAKKTTGKSPNLVWKCFITQASTLLRFNNKGILEINPW